MSISEFNKWLLYFNKYDSLRNIETQVALIISSLSGTDYEDYVFHLTEQEKKMIKHKRLIADLDKLK